MALVIGPGRSGIRRLDAGGAGTTSDVIAALDRLGFVFEPDEGWHAGRAPAPSDLAMALAYAMAKDPHTGEQLVTLGDFFKHGAAVLVISFVVLWFWVVLGYWSWLGFPGH